MALTPAAFVWIFFALAIGILVVGGYAFRKVLLP